MSHETSALRLCSAATAAALAALAAAPARAQDSNVTPLGRVILGFGTEAVALDTPQAVTVIDEDDLDREQASTVGQIFDLVPGAQSIGSDRPGGLSFNIRGIGELAAADESRIIVQVDGVNQFYEQYRMGSFFSDPELYRRVEVLRGPASSTLYGSGALGGVVAFETRRATDFVAAPGDHALRFRLSGESNGGGALASVIYAARPSESFDYLFALNHRSSGNWQDGDGQAVEGTEFAALTGLASATLHFGDGLEQALTLSYSAFDTSADNATYSQTGTLAFGTIDRDVRSQTLALNYENPVTGNPLVDLDVTLSFTRTEVDQYDASSPIPSPLFADGEYAYQTVALDARNVMNLSGGGVEHYLTLGAQVSRQDRHAETAMGPLGFHPEGTDERLGLFVQSEMIFPGGLTLVPGARIDVVSQSPDASVPGGADVDAVLFSPKIAAFYEIGPEWGLFGSVARTERTATLDELYSYDTSDGETPALSLAPEEATSYELGFTFSRQNLGGGDNAFDLRTTLFYSDITNLIERDSSAGTPYYRNVGEAEIWGVEVEAAYESPLFFARAAYSDVHGQNSLTGQRLTSIPQRSLGLQAGFRAPRHGLEYGWRGYFADDITYPTEHFEGYQTHDLFLAWEPQRGPLEGLRVDLAVENLADATYRNSLDGDNGRGRSAQLTLTRAFEF
ncbi:TonB-dependent receptor [Rhodobacterales bacterium HKCCE2091]|nr:TonB-dependent receptor [Rhodobacterales bacterium HKCCE2091]